MFIESCSNPNGHIFDFSILPQLKKLSSIFVCVVDNTWLTDVIFNPFEYGADIVVTSLTKYYSGGNAIAGAILGSLEKVEPIYHYTIRSGLYVSPYNIDVILKNIQTLEKRIQKSSKTTLKILKKLNKIKNLKLNHPFLDEHDSNKLAKKYFKNELYPSVFTFFSNKEKKEVLKMMKESNIEHKTSFGAKHLRTDPYPKKYGDETLCRIAIGYEDRHHDIKKDLVKLVRNLI